MAVSNSFGGMARASEFTVSTPLSGPFELSFNESEAGVCSVTSPAPRSLDWTVSPAASSSGDFELSPVLSGLSQLLYVNLICNSAHFVAFDAVLSNLSQI